MTALQTNLKAPRQGVYYMTFPNRLLQAGEVVPFLGDIQNPRVLRVDSIRLHIESALARLRGSKAPKKEERIAIRRMMSAYWDNSSIFSMDLVGAVIRQGTFVQKMHDIDWLHSPSLRSTMGRLIVKYERFFHLMATYPDKVAVPTLDVDLAW